MIQNHNKTKALVVSKYRTANPPHGDLVLSVVSIHDSLNLDILGVKFHSKFTFEEHVHGIVSRVSHKIGIYEVGATCLCGLRCYYAFVLPILEYCSLLWGSAVACHLQLLELQMYSVARLILITVSCRCVIDFMLLYCVCCIRIILTRITVCSLCYNLLLPEFDIPDLRPQHIY